MTNQAKTDSSRGSIFWPWLARIISYGLLMVMISQILLWDAGMLLETKFSEHTFTEWSQQVFLMIMTLIFLITARQYADWRALSIILGGCAAIGLVREYNNFFNVHVFDGAWQLLALLVFTGTFLWFYPYRAQLHGHLRSFRDTTSAGVLLAGFVTTFVFSRLFGRTTFWETVMEDRYFRSVKNAAEEGVELLGYGLLLIASIEYYIFIRNQPPRAQNGR